MEAGSRQANSVPQIKFARTAPVQLSKANNDPGYAMWGVFSAECIVTGHRQ